MTAAPQPVQGIEAVPAAWTKAAKKAAADLAPKLQASADRVFGIEAEELARLKTVEAIHTWIRDDAPLSIKMAITPVMVDALVSRLSRLTPITAGEGEAKPFAERDPLYDKNGIPFRRGDVVKVFHYVGARNKRCYMYKQCLGGVALSSSPYALFSHLNFVEDRAHRDGPYAQQADGRTLPDYEIVQSVACDHEDRARALLNPSTVEGKEGQ